MSITPEELAALPLPRTREELLTRMPTARAALEGTIASLTEAQLTTPGPERWSVTDHLLHLAVWQAMVVAHLRDGNDHEVAGLAAEEYAAIGLEPLNALVYERTKATPLPEALARFRASYDATLAFLRQLPQETFSGPYWPDAPRSVMEKLAGDTYRHDLEHRTWIERLVTRG